MADDDSQTIGQDEIEELLRKAKGSRPAEPALGAGGEAGVSQSEIEALMRKGPGEVAPGGKPAPKAEEDDATKILGQADIEALLSAKQPPRPTATRTAPKPAPPPAADHEPAVAPADVELLLRQAEAALASIQDPGRQQPPPGAAQFQFEDFGGARPSGEFATLDLIRDVELDVKIELGRTNMYLEDVLRLRKGAVVPLDKLAGDPVDIFVNGRLVARGEVLVLNDNFCVRVAELVAGEATAAAG